MGFGDGKVENSFDALFDLDRDGVLDPVEQGIQFDYIMECMEEEEALSEDDDEDYFEDEDEFLDEDELEDEFDFDNFDSFDDGDD